MIEAFWGAFVEATGVDGPYEAWAFGDPSLPELATELALLVRDGPKRATAGLASDYETIGVETRRFGDVDEAFAWDEGEGDRTLEWWRRAHRRFFERQGTHIDDNTLMVLENFELLWPTPANQNVD
jgi:uncharacterized protein YhfF